MYIRMATLSLVITLAAGGAWAQNTAPPARNGDIYNGTAHEPNAGAVTSQEKAAGVALPPSQAHAQNNQVEQLDKSIQSGPSTSGPARSLACSTVPATCQKAP